jgi:hypothetical protein
LQYFFKSFNNSFFVIMSFDEILRKSWNMFAAFIYVNFIVGIFKFFSFGFLGKSD